ncbi:Na+/H+ antiporter NhaA [Nonomuraea sp. NPDC005692]|uniref:Na+/H+ antiporter NhaA n=1 Tax=Nonomuraea sp. NPDC005692 TaxID=3157168 RepID=UPI00340E48C0
MSASSRIITALRSDAVGGVLLIVAALTALAWANSSLAGSYEALRTWSFGPEWLGLRLSAQAWAADGLLAVFFFIVGNELKQELVHGELRDPRRAALPVVAALGGVVVPALLFLAVNAAAPGEAARGWGVPMATDIAFALAVLAVVGRGLPAPLRTFLLTLATVDDVCAVVVIAVGYTSGLNLAALAGAAAALCVWAYLQHGRGRAVTAVRRALPAWLLYGPLAVLIWALVHACGVHATIAGVAMGLLIRTRPHAGEPEPPSQRAEHVLRPFCAGVVLPVFALLSAGISLSGAGGFWAGTVTWGVLAGLLAGKPLGIVGAAWLTARLTSAHLNPRLGWSDIAGVGVLGGIGFTVSLLIAELSYTGPAYLTQAKGAILLATAAASVLAALILGARVRRHRTAGRAAAA